MRKYLVLLLAVSACECGQVQPLKQIPVCQANPDAPGCRPPIIDAGEPPPVDAGHPDAGHPIDAGPMSCNDGTVTGQICAPDMMSDVPNANIVVSGSCNGQAFNVSATADAMGNFTIMVPAGSWTLTASSGSFSRTYPITVIAGQTTAIGSGQICFQPNTTKIAVITGGGDKIENLLGAGTPAAGTTPAVPGLGFSPTLYDGTATGFNNPSTSSPPGGLQFLLDPNQLSQYNIIFIDCGAGRTAEAEADGGMSYDLFYFANNATTIGTNLRNFVMNGGSLYASDWAFMYVYLAAADQFVWQLEGGATTASGVTFPFDTYTLMGFDVGAVNATINDTNLAAYLGKSSVTITFPTASPKMTHWGLLSAVNSPASVLITGPVQACAAANGNPCSAANPTVVTAPLAALYQMTSGPGGVIAYTSFHNINQTTPTDIENILKYIIFQL